MECIVNQARRDRGSLEIFIIETKLKLAEVPAGRDISQADEVLEYLTASLGKDWLVWKWLLESERLGLPQARSRMHICGRKKNRFKGATEPELRPEQFRVTQIPLADILDNKAPKAQVTDLSETMRANLASYKKLCNDDPDGSIFVVDVSRPADAKPRANMCPEITPTSGALFVFQKGSRDFHRFLQPAELLMLQGFSPEVLNNLAKARVVQAAGSA
eukprot:6356419-Pyramimonas_sp.AAC.1